MRGEFSAAAASFARAQPIAPDPGELAGSTDWLWMSLSRAGRGAEAKAMLDRRPESRLPPVTNAYTRRLQLYRGEIGPDAVLTPADTDEVQIATLAYGLGNWYLVRGDKAQARVWFERSVQVGRMARLRVHSLGSGAAATSLSGRSSRSAPTRAFCRCA